MPGVVIAHTEDWRVMQTQEKLHHMLGMSLDDCLAILAYPVDECLEEKNATILNIKVQTIRAILHTCTKLGIEHKKAESSVLLEQMRARLKEGAKK